ncbi:hypothetical protein [Terrabacter carboxydivorans]
MSIRDLLGELVWLQDCVDAEPADSRFGTVPKQASRRVELERRERLILAELQRRRRIDRAGCLAMPPSLRLDTADAGSTAKAETQWPESASG